MFRNPLLGILCFSLSAIAAGSQTVAHWRFEGDTAGFLSDASGNGRSLSLPATAAPAQVDLPASGPGSRFQNPLPQNGLANLKVAAFNGKAATAADDQAFTAGAFTVEAYVHIAAATGGTQFIAGHFDSGANQRSWALVVATGKLALYMSATGSGMENLISNFEITPGKDYYVAAAVNVSNTAGPGALLYVRNLTDNTPIAFQQFTHSTTALLDSTAPFSIGATANGTSPFNGIIDEVRVSNQQLAFNQLLAVSPTEQPPQPDPLPTADGFRGIWYQVGPTGNQYGYKYSGGMATYPQQHAPIAIYSPEANKTFFVYGGTNAGNTTIFHMVSYYDHATRQVARPRVLLNKQTTDAHDNPVLGIDDAGYIWIFSNTHGDSRRSWIHKSTKPYSIDRFEDIPLPADVFPANRFNYGRPMWVPSSGFLFLHTRYNSGERDLYWTTSTDGRNWTPRQTLSQMLQGQYQISGRLGGKVGTAFNVHPPAGGLDSRTNLYYLQTTDMGTTWTTVNGTAVTTPLTDAANPALIRDYRSEGRLVYLKDMGYDGSGHPVILYLTAANSNPGPQTPTRMVHTARWTGSEWIIRDMVPTDHNYDHGSLYLEADGTWRVIGTFLDGPQQFGTGGEIGIWTSKNQGATWQLVQQVTSGSEANHNYPRRPYFARDDFHALWADGNAFEQSGSSLYFTDRHGDAVLRLPTQMDGDFAFPEVVRVTDPNGDADADGASNENEFAAGTDPRDPRSLLRIENLEPPLVGGFRLSFPTIEGKTYRVMHTANLASGSWELLRDGVPGTGSILSIDDTDAVDELQRFYRVEVAE